MSLKSGCCILLSSTVLMNKKVSQSNKQSPFYRLSAITPAVLIRLAVLVLFAAAGITGILQQQAYAAQTAADYCNKYSSTGEKNACKDGINGADCNDYAIVFDQSVADICHKAARDRAAGTVTPGNVIVTPSPSVSASPKPSPSTSFNELQDILDQTQDLEEYTNLLHEFGPNSDVDLDEEPDDTVGSYINGAGKKQKIETIHPGTGPNSPAILFFNGGGWHANDKNGQKISKGEESKESNGTTHSPIGGGAAERGFATFDVTYRLGSSGVYYMFEDVMLGIKHMRNNADKYGIDPNRIVIWGDSSGGSLAMRAAASGKSGAKVAVGWSPPTNAYTGLFHSYKSLLIGMDHSTCIPTDLAGLTNATDLLSGGSGEVAEYGQGLSSNDFSGIGMGAGPEGIGFDSGNISPINLITDVLKAGQYAMDSGKNVEAISSQLESGDPMALSGGVINLASKKFLECIDNFNALSPALFASPDTPPSYVAGFHTDDTVAPDQVTGMRDKLRNLGIRSEMMMLNGDPGGADGITPKMGNHLDYDARFVCETINFIYQEFEEEDKLVDCETGATDSGGLTNEVAGGGGEGSGSGSGGSGGGGSQNTEQKKTCTWPEANKTWTEGDQGYDGCLKLKGAADKGANKQANTQYNCLSGDDVLIGTSCQYTDPAGCSGGSRTRGYNGLSPVCEYGALENMTNTGRMSAPNCRSTGGTVGSPHGVLGDFQADCWKKK